jgi:hypothetical protein
MNDLNPTSRGNNWRKMKVDGVQNLEQKNPNGKITGLNILMDILTQENQVFRNIMPEAMFILSILKEKRSFSHIRIK